MYAGLVITIKLSQILRECISVFLFISFRNETLVTQVVIDLTPSDTTMCAFITWVLFAEETSTGTVNQKEQHRICYPTVVSGEYTAQQMRRGEEASVLKSTEQPTSPWGSLPQSTFF